MSPPDTSALDDDGEEFPAVDDHLAPIELPYEVWNGELVRVSPAHFEHAEPHADLILLLKMHVTRKYVVVCDMLTRVSLDTDIAPDISVLAAAKDRRTGGRKLEELAFEIVNTSRLNKVGERAAKLARRGVRRVFVLDVKRERVLEWSQAAGAWKQLDPGGELKDRTLAVPLPIAALLHAGLVDDAVAHALVARRDPVLQKVRARDRAAANRRGFRKGEKRGEERGVARGLGKAILDVLALRGIALTAREQTRILDEPDQARLRTWLRRAVSCTSARELFARALRAPARRPAK